MRIDPPPPRRYAGPQRLDHEDDNIDLRARLAATHFDPEDV
jgi:hypothetical protein